jgi:hypothetical protein
VKVVEDLGFQTVTNPGRSNNADGDNTDHDLLSAGSLADTLKGLQHQLSSSGGGGNKSSSSSMMLSPSSSGGGGSSSGSGKKSLVSSSPRASVTTTTTTKKKKKKEEAVEEPTGPQVMAEGAEGLISMWNE